MQILFICIVRTFFLFDHDVIKYGSRIRGGFVEPYYNLLTNDINDIKSINDIINVDFDI